MNGNITLNRQIFDWEWWGDIVVSKLWITILMLANWKDREWQGRVIKRGSFITSYPNLASMSGLSVQQVRTGIKKLKSTGEIQQITTNKYQLIVVVNYDKFQSLSDEVQQTDNRQSTGNQQTDNSQITFNQHQLNKENKEIREKGNKEIINSSGSRGGASKLVNRLTDEEAEIVFATYTDADLLIDEVQDEVDSKHKTIRKPFEYIVGYARKTGWQENGKD